MPLIVQIVLFVVSALVVVIISEITYALINKKVQSWISDRCSEINKELKDIGFRYREGAEYRFIFHKYDGFYIATDSLNDQRRTKLMSAYKLRKVLFKMYETPYNEVLEPMFIDYENRKKEIAEKQNKERFSDNNYKRAVKFKRPNEDK